MKGGRIKRRRSAWLRVELGEHDTVAEDISEDVLDIVGCTRPRARYRGSGSIGSRRRLVRCRRFGRRRGRRCECRRWSLCWARCRSEYRAWHRDGSWIRRRNGSLSGGNRCGRRVFGRGIAHGRCLRRRSVGGHVERRKVVFGVVECSGIVVGNLVIDGSRLGETSRRRRSGFGRGRHRSGWFRCRRCGRRGRRRCFRSGGRGNARHHRRCGLGLRL